ncbi:hypothetical protein Dimus_024476 [Dionaea muscipula]
MATSWSSSSLDTAASGTVIRCRCNEVAAMFTSKTRDNPFRRFVKCVRRRRLVRYVERIDADSLSTAKMGIVKRMDRLIIRKRSRKRKKNAPSSMVAKHATYLIQIEALVKFSDTVSTDYDRGYYRASYYDIVDETSFASCSTYFVIDRLL